MLTIILSSANRTLVPIHCRVVKDLNDFDGSWTVCLDFLPFEYILTFILQMWEGTTLFHSPCAYALKLIILHVAGMMDEINLRMLWDKQRRNSLMSTQPTRNSRTSYGSTSPEAQSSIPGQASLWRTGAQWWRGNS